MEPTVLELIKYIERYNPESIQKMQGVSWSRIDYLEDLVLSASILFLPDNYKEFLALMGTIQPINFAKDSKMDIDSIISFYEDALQDIGEISQDSIAIARGGWDTGIISVECWVDEFEETQTNRIFLPDGNRIHRVLNDSFMGFLFRRAFEEFCYQTAPHHGAFWVESERSPLEEIQLSAEKFGLSKLWFSDSVSLSMSNEREDLMLFLDARNANSNGFLIYGSTKEEILQLATDIGNKFTVLADGWARNKNHIFIDTLKENLIKLGRFISI